MRAHLKECFYSDQLLLLIVQAEREAKKRGIKPSKACLVWSRNGKAIIVRDSKELTNNLLPLASCQAKFSSLVRRLYRWGFRQASSNVSGTNHYDGNVKEKLFSHPLFQRDNKPLIEGMRSITAEGTRRAIAAKHLIDMQESRLLDQLSSQKHIQALDSSLSSPSLAPISSTDALIAAASSLGPQYGTSTAAFPTLVSSSGLRVLTDARTSDLCWSAIMNHRRGLAAAAVAADVVAALGTIPFHNPAGSFFASSSSGPQFLTNDNTATHFSLIRPDLVDQNMTERNRTTLDKILGSAPPVSWRESLLRSIVEQNHQQDQASLDS